MKHKKRVYVAIILTWIFSEMAGGQFLGFGADVGNITTSAIQSVIGIAPKNRNMITWEKPLLRKIEETAAEHASSLNDSEREQLQTILEAVHPSSSGSQDNTTIEEDNDRPPSVLLEAVTLKCENSNHGPIMSRRFSDAVHSISVRGRKKSVSFGTRNDRRRHSEIPTATDEDSRNLHSLKPPLKVSLSLPTTTVVKATCVHEEHNGCCVRSVEKRKMRRLSEIISEWDRPSRTSLSHMYTYARRESVYIARKKLAGLKDWALDLLAKLKSKQGMAIRREARATKLVATVMVVFLVCWLPFFTLNMIKIYKLIYNSWPVDLEIWFHWFTALGYLNSSLNFFIYSTINPKFRHSFRRILGFRRSKRRKEKSWMQPPKESSKPLANRKVSMQKPEIVIDEISPNRVSISAGGNTTFR
ncbi:hypothetical protein ANCDUO_12984 [Ancylostoma duodenale]|uniref:G-protein coupled receptors family 1 profile domain-containing protein n=1 Tax=Ancylostoma duodenale TaxID=51022 RepID=A0A0C2D448_9BILA|nr:hypothetical protein ANCDUO_12984 [Ancylostoma duodenale]